MYSNVRSKNLLEYQSIYLAASFQAPHLKIPVCIFQRLFFSVPYAVFTSGGR